MRGCYKPAGIATENSGMRLINNAPELKSGPRVFDPPALFAERQPLTSPVHNQNPAVSHPPHDQYIDDDDLPYPVRQANMRKKVVSDEELQAANRTTLRKFETLTIGGQGLTGIQIGGFPIDLKKTETKVRELLPIPPSKLAVIFVDDELNFLHHFFQCLKQMLGAQKFNDSVSKTFVPIKRDDHLAEFFLDLIERQYSPTDTETVAFMKKVVEATFEAAGTDRYNDNHNELYVATNLWGFQYIEPGMTLKDVDIRMWLATCYSHYETVWFNNFKLVGIPDFAVEKLYRDECKNVIEDHVKTGQPKIIRRSTYDRYDDRPYPDSSSSYRHTDEWKYNHANPADQHALTKWVKPVRHRKRTTT